MTTAEAIKEIKRRLASRCYADPDYIEALEMAVDALRRQEPMKPVIEQGAPSYYGGTGRCRDYCGCQKCGEAVGRGDDKANYCPDCGQKIDWEDEA